ncbi:MAG: YibE/F family protein [Candidatus Levybacteria bacterium]|nr:YibE/F family protein [Candidatus Levybacteria bacterium]
MRLRLLFLVPVLFFLFASPVLAQNTKSQALTPIQQGYLKAKVIKIEKMGKMQTGNTTNAFQTVTVRLLDGPDKDKQATAENGGMFTITEEKKVRPGDTVILSKLQNPDKKTVYRVADLYRLPSIVTIILGFFVLVTLIAGKKGIGAILGMIISLVIIIYFIVPHILSGQNPLFISIVGAIAILGLTMFLSHGFSRATLVALSSTVLSLVLCGIFGALFVGFSRLSGLGSEDIYSLQQGFAGTINFQGLLLGGIIIGALGVLDDVTTTQSATIFTLFETDHKLTFANLFKKGMVVGREHIASLVNTLVLAYAGASIGIFIFLLLALQQNTQPLWVILNSEVITEEIVRTIAGSIGLVLAVPITTLLAAFFAKYAIKIN